MSVDPTETAQPDDQDRVTTTAAQTCPQCMHGWHGRRVCRDANCCSCRLTWRDAWKAGYMQGWRDYPSALWRGFYPPTEVEMESTTPVYNGSDEHDVNITATLRRDVTLSLCSDGTTRLPVLTILSQGGHYYRFTLSADQARDLGTSLIEKAGEAVYITADARLRNAT